MSAPGDQCSGLSWTIDAWGNRTAQSVTGGTCFSPSTGVGTNNRLLGGPYSYDTAGNLLNDGTHTYTYDAEERATKVDGGTTATYVYDALGNRVEKTAGGVDSQYLYNENGTVNTVFANGLMQRMFVYLDGLPLAEYFENTTYFVHTDHLGSTRLLSRLDQSVRESDDYYPYGELIPTGGGTGDILKFNGKENDGESNLDNFGARYDASFLGRFMTPDWATKPTTVPYANFGNPQSLNLYSYVQNNPTTVGDPDGHLIDVEKLFEALDKIEDKVAQKAGEFWENNALNIGMAIMVVGTSGEGGEDPGGMENDEERGLYSSTMRGAQRQAMREEGIPTSQQPETQVETEAGRQYTYKVPKPGGGTEEKIVQRNNGTDRSHPGQEHVEAGRPKPMGQKDKLGRPRLTNKKTKVNVKKSSDEVLRDKCEGPSSKCQQPGALKQR